MFWNKKDKDSFEKFKFEITKLNIEKNDIIVLRFKENLTNKQFENISKVLKDTFPDNKKLILEGDINIKIIKNE